MSDGMLNTKIVSYKYFTLKDTTKFSCPLVYTAISYNKFDYDYIGPIDITLFTRT